jgi:hypothetical protein
MSDLAEEMAELGRRLGAPPEEGGRCVLFLTPDEGDAASRSARAFALEAARTAARPVWLFDLDLLRSGQHQHFSEHQDAYGALGPTVRASPSDTAFFRIAGADTEAASLLAAQSVGERGLWVTRFRREMLDAGQRVQILADGSYWREMRPHAELIAVDGGGPARLSAALAISPFMDDVVIVASARRRDADRIRELSGRIDAAGGRCAGLVLSDPPPRPPGAFGAFAR